jgi:hypothetical protein
MSTLPDFAERQVSITLTGAEWFALLAKINDKDSLNAKGRARYKAAVDGIAARITAESERTEPDAGIRWHTVLMDDSIEVVDQDAQPVFSVVCLPDDMAGQVERAVNLAAAAPEMVEALQATEALDNRDDCEDCHGEGEPELCGACFPAADDARLMRRAVLAKIGATS